MPSIRRRPAQARSAATVAAILSAARELLHNGEAISARTIAERAGIAAPTMYRYFADTDAVVDALVLEHADIAEAMVERVLEADAGDDITTAFRRVLDGYLQLYSDRPVLIVAWRSKEMAERQRLIEQQSDRGLARRLATHLVEGGAIDRNERRAFTDSVVTHWQMAGVAIGAVLQAPDRRARATAEADARAFVDYAATRCDPSNRTTATPAVAPDLGHC